LAPRAGLEPATLRLTVHAGLRPGRFFVGSAADESLLSTGVREKIVLKLITGRVADVVGSFPTTVNSFSYLLTRIASNAAAVLSVTARVPYVLPRM
jgi:hypothetical protein